MDYLSRAYFPWLDYQPHIDTLPRIHNSTTDSFSHCCILTFLILVTSLGRVFKIRL